MYLSLGIVTCSFRPVDNNVYNGNQVNLTTTSVLDTKEVEIGETNTDILVDLRSYSVTELTASFQVLVSFSDDANTVNNYYIGYRGEGNEYLPASLYFNVKTSNGKVEKRSAPIIPVQQNDLYDGLGANLGRTNINTYCDIELAYGEEVLYREGVQLFNIFYYDSTTREVDLTKNSYVDCTYASIDRDRYATNYNSKDYFEMKYTGASNYAGFSAFAFDVQNFGTEKYPTLSTTTARMYSTNEKDIANGISYVKSSLSFGGTTKFVFEFNDGSQKVLTSTNKTSEITNGGHIVLLFEDIDYKDVTNIKIQDLYYQFYIYNTSTHTNLARTNYSIRFGTTYTNMVDLVDSNGQVVVEKGENFYEINNDLIVGLVFGLSTFIFLAIVVPSYFYLKKKNRNDEFKRMNTKAYVTTSIYGYLCIESLLLLTTFVSIRSTVFNNTLNVFNPTDAFIVVFGVMGIILVGYFIRYFVIMFKNNAEKKRRDRLNINKDVIDDGTLIIRK